MPRIALFIFLISFFVHLTSLTNTFIWDDEQFVYNNYYVAHMSLWPEYFTTTVTQGAGVASAYYRPITTLSYALDNAIWGMHPMPFHLTNTLLHAFASMLVFLAVQRILMYLGSKKSFLLPSMCAILFALYPTSAEAVANISSRGDSLHTVFGLISLILFLSLHRTKTENGVIVKAASVLLFLFLALLSKEIAAVWGGILLILIILRYLKTKILPKAQTLTGITGCIFVCIYMIVHLLAFPSPAQQMGWNTTYAQSLLVRIATFIFHVLPEYFTVLVVPISLHMEKSVEFVTTPKDISFASLVILCITLVCAFIWILLGRRIHKDNTVLQLFAVVWFFGFLLPVSGIIPSNGLLYDHWLYLPIIGWVVFWFTPIISLLSHTKRDMYRKFFAILFTGICLIISMLTIHNILLFRNAFTLYPHILKYTQTARVHNNLAMAYADVGKNEEAMHHYTKAIELSPYYPQIHHNLANMYVTLGRYEEAEKEYMQALQLDKYFMFSVNKLIELHMQLGNKEKVVKWAEYGKDHTQSSILYDEIISEFSQDSIATPSSTPSSQKK